MTPLVGFDRRRLTGVAAVALAVVLAGCGSQAKTVEVKKKVAPSPRTAVLASIRTTAAAKSARISMKMTSTGPADTGFAFTADGVTDFTTGDGSLTMRFTGMAAKFLSGSVEVRTVNGATYVQMPESFGVLGGGKWLKTPDLGATNGLVPGFGESDPSRFLAYLETVSAGVKKVGTESIRGVDTTHYEASLDLGKAVDRADVPASLRDDLGKIFQKNGESFAIPADVWVDGDGLTRRIQLTFDFAKAIDPVHGTALPTMSMSIDLYDFGVPVHVEAPPAGDVEAFPFGASGAGGTAS